MTFGRCHDHLPPLVDAFVIVDNVAIADSQFDATAIATFDATAIADISLMS